jgi:hypothetical protein
MFNSRFFILVIVFAMLVGCTQIPITGSGNVVTQEEPITGFDKVDISYSFDVNISQGESFSVVIRADDNLVEHLQVVKQGSTLKIGLKPNSPDLRSATLQAEVTMPELTGLDMSGSSHATITGFKSAQALVVDASGASHLQGDIEADTVSFNLDGSSEVILTGSAQNVIIEEASGSSDVNLTDFPVIDASVKAGGKSQVTVNVSGRLDVDASNGANVYYLGNPTLGTIDTTGSATVERK